MNEDEPIPCDAPPTKQSRPCPPRAPPEPPEKREPTFWERVEAMRNKHSDSMRAPTSHASKCHSTRKTQKNSPSARRDCYDEKRRRHRRPNQKGRGPRNTAHATRCKRVDESYAGVDTEPHCHRRMAKGTRPRRQAFGHPHAAIETGGRQTWDSSLRPFAPRNSTIAKVPFATETRARQGRFALHNQPQTMVVTRPEPTTLWASLVRPPELAYRRRILGQSADTVRAVLPADPTTTIRAGMPAGAILYDRPPVLEITQDGWLEATGFWHACDGLRRKKLGARVNTRRKD